MTNPAVQPIGDGTHYLGRVTLFSTIILVDKRGWLLLQERDEFPATDPEKWGFVGGHVDAGEEFEAAAYRELEEETRVQLDPGELVLWREFPMVRADQQSHDTMQVFVAPSALTDDDIDCQEGRQIVFVDPAHVLGLDLGGTPRLILPEFLDSDRYRSMCP